MAVCLHAERVENEVSNSDYPQVFRRLFYTIHIVSGVKKEQLLGIVSGVAP